MSTQGNNVQNLHKKAQMSDTVP